MVFTTTMSILVLGQVAAEAKSPSVAARFEPRMLNVVHDVTGEGAVWSAGENWKMKIDGAGAAFIPVLGERAPRNLPLAMRLAGSPGGRVSRTGDVVSIDRGDIVERYEMGIESVEQSFVLRTRPAADFRLRLEVTTELVASDVAEGLRFAADGIGGIVYGDVTLRDARGAEMHVASEWRASPQGGAIELPIPAEFAATAELPIEVDPVLSTFSLGGSTTTEADPDVAYNEPTGDYLYVYERVVSASDIDIVGTRKPADGSVGGSLAFELSDSASTTDPAIACARDEALVVWRHDTGLNESIRARSYDAVTFVNGAIFTVSTAAQLSPRLPDVGATDAFVNHNYVVGFLHDQALSSEMNGRLQWCSATAASGAVQTITSLTPRDHISALSLAQTSGPVARFTAVWRESDDFQQANHPFLRASIFNLNGVALGSSLEIVDGSASLGTPAIAGDGGQFMVVWADAAVQFPSTSIDIFGHRLAFDSALQSLKELAPTPVNLSVLELGSTAAGQNAQNSPAVSKDGCRYTVLYRERPDASSTAEADLFGMTILAEAATPSVIESHVALDTSSTDATQPAIAAAYGDDSIAGHHALGFSLGTNLSGAFWTSLQGGSITKLQTGCGAGLEPTLVTFNTTVEAGGPFEFISNMPAASSALLVIGPQGNLPLCASCALGVVPLVITAIPDNFIIETTIPCDPGLVDVVIALQVIEVSPTPLTGAHCGPPKYSSDLRVSDTLRLHIG